MKRRMWTGGAYTALLVRYHDGIVDYAACLREVPIVIYLVCYNAAREYKLTSSQLLPGCSVEARKMGMFRSRFLKLVTASSNGYFLVKQLRNVD